MPKSDAAKQTPVGELSGVRELPRRPHHPAAQARSLRERWRARSGGIVVRVDRVSALLALVVVLLLLLVTAFVTLLVSGGDDSSPPKKAAQQPTVTLNGPAVAAYIADNYTVTGVTCPTVATPIGGSFLCSDPSGTSFTVELIDQGRAYAVHPNQ